MNNPFKLFLLVVGLFLTASIYQTALAQADIDAVLNRATVRKIPNYEFAESFSEQILLKMAYRTYAIANAADLRLVSKVKVTKVELVYTLYPNDGTFQSSKQVEINKQRLAVLYKELPALFKPEIVWELVPQTRCSSAEQAKEMFHGFVIHYKMPNGKASIKLSTDEDHARVGLPDPAKKKQN